MHVLNYLKILVLNENLIMCDRKGVIYRGDKLDQWKSKHAIETKFRTLEDVINGADVSGLFQKMLCLKIWLNRWLKIP